MKVFIYNYIMRALSWWRFGGGGWLQTRDKRMNDGWIID